MDLIEIYFYNIFANNTDYMLIFREKGGKARFLPMVIGTSDAGGILKTAEKQSSGGPFLTDVLYSFIRNNSCSLERMVINSLRKGIFYSEIHIKDHEGMLHRYSVRPSEGLALVIRSGCPLFVKAEVLEEIEVNPVIQEALETIQMDRNTFSKSITAGSIQLREQGFSIKDLANELDIAISEENYEKAAVIRDKIKKLSDKL
jgi:hypothetical protein